MKKVALITGGARGIGLGISRYLAKEGLDLAICGMRDESAVEDILQELQSTGANVLYVQADVANADARKSLLEKTRSHFARLDVLVNNAGIAPRERADILTASEKSFDELIRTNLQGPYFLTQAVANWMIEQKNTSSGFEGCIINISSISSTVASVNRGEYCISKAGITMATKLWAIRLAEFGINVYEVQPGIIETDMTAGVKAKYDKLIAEGLVPQGRWGTTCDVGKAVAMLIRGDLAYSTGQIITIDGGMMIQRL